MPRISAKHEIHEIDAAGQVLGRLATRIATILIGKDKATYMPNADMGGAVRLKNAGQIKLTGNKINDKVYHHYSGYPGGMKVRKVADEMARDPGRVIKAAVDRMLPKNTLRSRRLKRLTIVK